MDCTYREAKAYAQSFFHNKEIELKEKIILFENMSDKILYNDPNIAKNPQNIRLIDRYEQLFADDFNKMAEEGLMRPKTKEQQIRFMEELADEIKGGGNL
jgi:hypothetical protein